MLESLFLHESHSWPQRCMVYLDHIYVAHALKPCSSTRRNMRLRCCKLEWQARTTYKVIKWKGTWPEEAIHMQKQDGAPGSEISDRKLP